MGWGYNNIKQYVDKADEARHDIIQKCHDVGYNIPTDEMREEQGLEHITITDIPNWLYKIWYECNVYRTYGNNNELVHTFKNLQYGDLINETEVSTYITTPTGYTFNKWNPVPTEGKWKIEKENFNISALFNLNQYNLYAYSNGGGTATVDKSIVEYGGTATWTATPNTGYKFTSWSDGTTTLSNTKTNINSNISLSAIFEDDKYTISYDMNGHGSKPDEALTSYTKENLPYTPPNAINVAGYNFINWTPSNIPTGSTGNKTFTANWREMYTALNFNKKSFNTDYSVTIDGWRNPGGWVQIGIKWIGSNYTTSWIAYQPQDNNAMVSQLNLDTNPDGYYHYNGTELAYTDSSAQSTLKSRTGYWGCGGLSLSSISPNSSTIATGIKLALHGSAYCQYASYSSVDTITNNNDGTFRAEPIAPGTGYQLLVLGNKITVTVTLNDGFTITKTSTDSTYTFTGKWRTISANTPKCIMTFDWRDELLAHGIPKDGSVYVTKITLTTKNSTHDFNCALINGFELYGN